MQSIQVDFAVATTTIGGSFYLNEAFSINANYSTNTYSAPFNITIYKCMDPNCLTCSFDLPNLATGSELCSACIPTYTLYNNEICTICGDGLVQGTEACDAGAGLGCLPDCSGPEPNFVCAPGSPSVCTCATGYSLVVSSCVVVAPPPGSPAPVGSPSGPGPASGSSG